MKTIRLCIFLFLTSISLLFTACQGEEGTPIEQEDYADRTILVYLGRDNNLWGERERRIEFILNGWNGKGNLIIYEDKKGSLPCLMEAHNSNGFNDTRIIHQYEEQNSADAETLKKVIQETRNLYPAQSYGLIIFSHASGWLPKNTITNPRSNSDLSANESTRSIIIDDKDEMELVDFANALPNNLFDFIILEACYMSGIEVMYELRDKAKYILASSAEITSPGFTHVYSKQISQLFKKNLNLVDFAKEISAELSRTYDANKSSGGGTLSVIQTSCVEMLGNWIIENIDMEKPENISDIQYFDENRNNKIFFDFKDYYLRRLSSDTKKAVFTEMVNSIVVHQSTTPTYRGFQVNQHSGLTTYIPQLEYPLLNEKYKNLRWYRRVVSQIDKEE